MVKEKNMQKMHDDSLHVILQQNDATPGWVYLLFESSKIKGRLLLQLSTKFEAVYRWLHLIRQVTPVV